MKSVSRLAFAAALAIGFCPVSQAQTGNTVAHLRQVTGNVLVSRESGLGAGSDEQPLAQGARVITTANSEAIVRYDNGCEVRLKPNQRFEVKVDKPCAALMAEAESILLEPAGALAGGVDLSAILLAPAFNAGVFGVGALLLDRAGTNVSPN